MEITCQYCGTTAIDRVMCPSCGRRMQPVDAHSTPPEPARPASPFDDAPPPPGYYPPPSYPSGPGSEVGPWGGPLVPVVLFDRAATVRTSRPTVFFRVILAIPHFVILYFLALADNVIMFICWFAALFTARVPQGMYGFMAWVAAYQTRVGAYAFLLTDKWPTFSETDAYPVAIQFPGPERLNRAAVLFRLILSFPASILASLVALGAAVALAPVGWLIVGVMGRVPVPLFDSLARVTRYQIRLRAYFSMLTSAYPTGLFSERNEPWHSPPPPGPYTLVAPQPNSGSRLSIAYTVLGVAGFVGLVALSAVSVSVNDDHDKLVNAYNDIDLAPPSCPTGSGQLQCLNSFGQQAVTQLRTFDDKVSAISFSSDVSAEVTTLHGATQKLIDDYNQLSSASSDQQLLSLLPALAPDGSAFDNAVQTLADDLNNE